MLGMVACPPLAAPLIAYFYRRKEFQAAKNEKETDTPAENSSPFDTIHKEEKKSKKQLKREEKAAAEEKKLEAEKKHHDEVVEDAKAHIHDTTIDKAPVDSGV